MKTIHNNIEQHVFTLREYSKIIDKLRPHDYSYHGNKLQQQGEGEKRCI